jgi:hypothetical protein
MPKSWKMMKKGQIMIKNTKKVKNRKRKKLLGFFQKKMEKLTKSGE